MYVSNMLIWGLLAVATVFAGGYLLFRPRKEHQLK